MLTSKKYHGIHMGTQPVSMFWVIYGGIFYEYNEKPIEGDQIFMNLIILQFPSS